MPDSVKGVSETYEDLVQLLLIMEVLFTLDSKDEVLFFDAPSGSIPSLFFGNCIFGLGLRPVQDDF